MDGSLQIAPLRLFWWKAVPNFGDALSALVVAHISGRPVRHAGAGQCDLFAIGSVLQVARRRLRTPRADGVRPWVWGSGLLSPVNPDFVGNVQVALLRGPVTAALLGISARRFGDPGLLAPDILGKRPARGDRIAVVPHHTQVDDPAVLALVGSDPVFDLVDPRRPVRDVVARIGSAACVVASSLHGLVVADAFGIPSLWADPGAQGRLKYHDYAAGIGRALIAPVPWSEAAGMAAGLSSDRRLPHQAGIDAARAALKDTFPAQHRAMDSSAAI